MKIKIISIVFFFLLALSSISFTNVNAVSVTENKIGNDPIQKISEQQDQKLANKEYEIYLSENVGVSNDGNSKNQMNHDNTPSVTIAINLVERLTVSTNDADHNMIILIKQNDEMQAIPDRISKYGKTKSNGKSIVLTNIFDEVSSSHTTDADQILDKSKYVFSLLYNDLTKIDSSLTMLSSFTIAELPILIQTYEHQESTSIVNFGQTHNFDLVNTVVDVSKNPLLVILLVPLSGYLLARAEGTKFKIVNIQKFVGYCFIVILVSSIVVAPLSISPIYLNNAYADVQNGTLNSESQNSTDVNVTNSISFNQFSNATNSLSFNQFSNATNPQSQLPSNTTNSSNQSSSNTVNVPTPTESWNFTDSNLKTTTVGKARIDDSENTTALSLNGDGYLKQNSTGTQNLSALTLSAWVKPDYSQGSPQFTVISKENTFILAVNNNIQPAKKAIFSVFDGIKWNTVESNSTIPENWTHLVATYDGSSISIYVNGTQESKIPLVGVSTISIHGIIENQTIGTLSSNSDVVIGAYMSSIRNNANNLFSGSLRDVKLYDSLLAPYQITGLYLGNNKQLVPVTENATLTVLQQNS
ncbi:MAG TPA: LamG domain-containing protein, partial [Candidatus Nitrosotalea sp.]|nr:LamG domain-containing protein [Candidatus Nitrosotalea sp.]